MAFVLLLLLLQGVPFTVCAESKTWLRPTPALQSKIWNDPRYRDGATAHEWKHHFISVEPGSASIHYHSTNLAGLWTESVPRNPVCSGRHSELWREVWVLLHRVVAIQRNGGIYTVVVERTGQGFEVIQFPRSEESPQGTIRFVNADGQPVE